jgi:hypothetical protein
MRGTWKTEGGGLIVAIIIVLIIAGSGAASAITSALVTVLIIIGSVIVLAVAGGIGVLVYRARSDRPGQAIAARPVYQLPPETRPQLSEPSKPAIGPGREVHLHLNVSPEQLAAIVRHYTEEDVP